MTELDRDSFLKQVSRLCELDNEFPPHVVCFKGKQRVAYGLNTANFVVRSKASRLLRKLAWRYDAMALVMRGDTVDVGSLAELGDSIKDHPDHKRVCLVVFSTMEDEWMCEAEITRSGTQVAVGEWEIDKRKWRGQFANLYAEAASYKNN